MLQTLIIFHLVSFDSNLNKLKKLKNHVNMQIISYENAQLTDVRRWGQLLPVKCSSQLATSIED